MRFSPASLALLLLACCAPPAIQAEPPAVASASLAPPSSSPAAQSRPADLAPLPSAGLAPSEQAPTPEQHRTLRAAVDAIDAGEFARASELLAPSNLPLARAYLAYAEHEQGHLARAEAMRATLNAHQGHVWDGMEQSGDTLRTDLLLRARFELEEAQREWSGEWADLLPCSVFARHAAEAEVGYGLRWGSTRDMHVIDMRQACVDRLLADAPAQARAYQRALTPWIRQLEAVAPRPDGTMYYAMTQLSYNALTSLLLAPELASSTPVSEADRREALRAWPGGTRAASSLAALRSPLSSALADATCAAATKRGRPLTPERCRSLAAVAVGRAELSRLNVASRDE